MASAASPPFFGLALDDELLPVLLPRPDMRRAMQATAARRRQHRQFRDRWVERADIGQPDDIDRLLERAESVFLSALEASMKSKETVKKANTKETTKETSPNYRYHRFHQESHRVVRADRNRRLALGYVRPPPRTALFGAEGGDLEGRDGGVVIRRYAERRFRPVRSSRLHGNRSSKTDMVSLAACCLPVEPSSIETPPFDVRAAATPRSTPPTYRAQTAVPRKDPWAGLTRRQTDLKRWEKAVWQLCTADKGNGKTMTGWPVNR